MSLPVLIFPYVYLTIGFWDKTVLNRSSIESCSEALTELFNNTILTSDFPGKLNVAGVTPIFKKDDPQKSKNYRPVSVLPVVSTVFERILYKQMSLHVEEYLSPYLCGYRKGFST